MSEEQTNKQKIKGVAAPRQLGQNDQTHRGATPLSLLNGMREETLC